MFMYQKTIFDRYYCMKSFCHLKTLEKNASKSSFLFTTCIMARKKHPVLKTPVPEQRLTSS